MSLENWLGLVGLLVVVIARGTLAAAKAAFTSVRRGRLWQLAEGGVPNANHAAQLAEEASRLLGTLYLGSAILTVLASALAILTLFSPLTNALTDSGLPGGWAAGLSLFLIVIGVACLLLIAGQLVPEAIAAARAEHWALRLSWIVRVAQTALWPLVRLMVWLSNQLASPFGGVPFKGTSLISEEEIKTLVDAGEEEGVIEEEEREMIYSIFAFGDTLAREVMVPRIDIVALDVNTPLPEAADRVIEAGHSRIPVYEGSIDNIVGLLYAKDLLAYLRNGHDDLSLRQILRPAYFVPETKKVDDLLREMQQHRIHMAIVVDEYGGTAGLVTVEDILEEIVGEIQDEYDEEEPVFEQVGEGEYIIDARMDLDDVNELLGTELSTESGETLGGLIYCTLGKVPEPGDRLEVDGLEIEVLTVKGRRIGKVRGRLEKRDSDETV
ncbi:MAG TPA: HlyC/CorC family transporter [Thermoflexia bacterium]|nr:HlyC/CorC family transporter [Thermoflexia bacterium]